MIVVIRYFGGIKLGAGGLVRAYSQAAQQAYYNVTKQFQAQLESFQIICDFAEEQTVRHWLTQHDGKVVDVQYKAQVLLKIVLPEQQKTALLDVLASLKQAILLDSDQA